MIATATPAGSEPRASFRATFGEEGLKQLLRDAFLREHPGCRLDRLELVPRDGAVTLDLAGEIAFSPHPSAEE